MKFQGVEMLLQDDDVVTSQKGFLSKHEITGETFLVKKMKHIGLGHFVVIGDKEKIEVTNVSRKNN